MTRAAANAGRSFEALLAFVHSRYANQRRALLEKIPTSGAFIRKGREIVFAARKSLPDYVGLVAGSGRAVVFDAKTTASNKGWRLDIRYLHQSRAILEWRSFGALAFFLVESRPLDEAFALFPPPYLVDKLPDLLGEWGPSIDFEDPTEDVVRVPIAGGVVDWLSAFENRGLV